MNRAAHTTHQRHKGALLAAVLDWMVRRGWLVASGVRTPHWCDEHRDYCPPRWYRPTRRR